MTVALKRSGFDIFIIFILIFVLNVSLGDIVALLPLLRHTPRNPFPVFAIPFSLFTQEKDRRRVPKISDLAAERNDLK